jgi:hypothetical protein
VETLKQMIHQRERWIDEKCPCYYEPSTEEHVDCICSEQAVWTVERDAIRELLKENERLRTQYARSHGSKQDAKIKAALDVLVNEPSDVEARQGAIEALQGGEDAE